MRFPTWSEGTELSETVHTLVLSFDEALRRRTARHTRTTIERGFESRSSVGQLLSALHWIRKLAYIRQHHSTFALPR